MFFWALARLVRRFFWHEEAAGPPPDLCCPMSLELFTDPVVAADGETYEFLGDSCSSTTFVFPERMATILGWRPSLVGWRPLL